MVLGQTVMEKNSEKFSGGIFTPDTAKLSREELVTLVEQLRKKLTEMERRSIFYHYHRGSSH